MRGSARVFAATIFCTPYLSVFSPNAGKCGKNAEQNNSEYPNMDTFYAVFDIDFEIISHSSQQSFAI